MTASSPKVVLGAGNVGSSSDAIAKYTTPEAAQAFLNLFRKHGYTDIDTARGYSPAAPQTSEPLLAQTDFKHWATIDTKVNSFGPGSHAKEKITESVEESLEALKVDKVSGSAFTNGAFVAALLA